MVSEGILNAFKGHFAKHFGMLLCGYHRWPARICQTVTAAIEQTRPKSMRDTSTRRECSRQGIDDQIVPATPQRWHEKAHAQLQLRDVPVQKDLRRIWPQMRGTQN